MNKKERKRVKQTRIKNKKLLKKYPWLAPRNVWSDKLVENEYRYTLFDEIPRGWKIAFGDMMIEEINQELVEHNLVREYRILQIKEKYGELRWYDGSTTKKIMDITDKYSVLSRNICICCGKPDVGYTSGWITPLCEKCYKGDPADLSENNRMVDSYEYSTFGSRIECVVDIKDTAQKIRDNWYRKHKGRAEENEECNTMHEE